MQSIARVLVVLLTAAAFADEPAKPQTAPQPSQSSVVSIPLSQYEQLRSTSENAAATVVDTLTIGGTFHDHNLALTFGGRSIGARTAVAVIRGATDVTLSGCSGDALIVRAGKGTFQLVALGSSFTLRCDVRLSGSDRLQMNVQPSVLAVRSAVTDGELVAGDEDKDGMRTFTLVRQVVGTGETLATTATGRYLITLLPDASRFRYTIQVHNPNRVTSPLPLKFVSSEHLQQIDSSAPYEIKDGSYIFAMPPGDSTITLSGELRGASFAPPVAASLQYAVIESHPLLRPMVQSAAQTPLKHVSTGETGVTTQYRGAVAFEIGPNERISWNVTRLEALRAISYAVRHVSHTFFVPANGPILGESEFQIENQGAPELMLPPKPEPTYVSLGDEAVLMTKNRDGQLTVPLSTGSQRVVVQHRQSVAHWGVVLARLDVPRVSVPATNTDVTLRYPDHWLPLWQSFATEAMLWRPDTAALLLFLLFAVWIERVLAFLGVSASRRIGAAAILAFAAMVIPTVLWITVASCVGLTVLWIAANRKNLSAAHVGGGSGRFGYRPTHRHGGAQPDLTAPNAEIRGHAAQGRDGEHQHGRHRYDRYSAAAVTGTERTARVSGAAGEVRPTVRRAQQRVQSGDAGRRPTAEHTHRSAVDDSRDVARVRADALRRIAALA
jgi:hypothetical protein